MDHGRVCRTETTSLVHTRCRISSKDWIHPRGRISSHRRINSNGRTSFHHRISSNGRTNSRIQDRIRPLDKTMDGYLIKTHGWIISSRCCLQVLLLLLTLTSMLMFLIKKILIGPLLLFLCERYLWCRFCLFWWTYTTSHISATPIFLWVHFINTYIRPIIRIIQNFKTW